jgi:hypothetical protein
MLEALGEGIPRDRPSPRKVATLGQRKDFAEHGLVGFQIARHGRFRYGPSMR